MASRPQCIRHNLNLLDTPRHPAYLNPIPVLNVDLTPHLIPTPGPRLYMNVRTASRITLHGGGGANTHAQPSQAKPQASNCNHRLVRSTVQLLPCSGHVASCQTHGCWCTAWHRNHDDRQTPLVPVWSAVHVRRLQQQKNTPKLHAATPTWYTQNWYIEVHEPIAASPMTTLGTRPLAHCTYPRPLTFACNAINPQVRLLPYSIVVRSR